ncbi:unnamed protein product [Trichobilharzia regenti]|nr:unnamed protein product [Trichobilharzia regenti]
MQSLSKNVALAAPNTSMPFTIWDVILWIGIASLSITGAHTYLVWYGSGTWYGHPTILSLKEIITVELRSEIQSSSPSSSEATTAAANSSRSPSSSSSSPSSIGSLDTT